MARKFPLIFPTLDPCVLLAQLGHTIRPGILFSIAGSLIIPPKGATVRVQLFSAMDLAADAIPIQTYAVTVTTAIPYRDAEYGEDR